MTAMHEGVGPDGKVYYPVFPYTSFTKMTDEDVLDMKAYLDTLEPVKNENKEPDFSFPYNVRSSVRVWRGLHFDAARYQPDGEQTDEWNRGAYLSEATGDQAISARSVDVVDTTGAGDAFTAALAVARARGDALPSAVRFAVAAGSLACTKFGAQPSMPAGRDVDAFLAS